MKEVFSAYIDKEISKKFKDYCEKYNLHKPAIIEKLIKEFLENAKKKS